MKNVQKAKCDGDFAPLRSQNRCVIKLLPIYIVKNLASFNDQKIKSLRARLKFTGINLWYDGSLW